MWSRNVDTFDQRFRPHDPGVPASPLSGQGPPLAFIECLCFPVPLTLAAGRADLSDLIKSIYTCESLGRIGPADGDLPLASFFVADSSHCYIASCDLSALRALHALHGPSGRSNGGNTPRLPEGRVIDLVTA